MDRLDALTHKVLSELEKQGFKGKQARVERLLNMRFDGSDTALMIKCDSDDQDFEAAFKREYKDEFGFLLESKIDVDDIKVRIRKEFTLPVFP